MSSAAPAALTGNRLLDALSIEERERWVSHMRRQPVTPYDMLIAPGKRERDVYFPLLGVISLMTPLEDGSSIEVATVGNEGMVGVHAFLGGGMLGNSQAMAQVPGEMLVMNADSFRAHIAGNGKLRSLLLAYIQALFSQISQAVACNGVHEIQQRTAKWLLQTHDRVEGDKFDLTQEFLADMLGVSRPSVSVAARTLQNSGLIKYTRGSIAVLDRKGLEEASCECYLAVRRDYDQFVGA